MRVGGIALVRRRLDARDRERNDEQRFPAERIAVASEDGAAVLLYNAGEPVEVRARRLGGFGRGQPDRSGRDCLSTDGLLARSLRFRRRHSSESYVCFLVRGSSRMG